MKRWGLRDKQVQSHEEAGSEVGGAVSPEGSGRSWWGSLIIPQQTLSAPHP